MPCELLSLLLSSAGARLHNVCWAFGLQGHGRTSLRNGCLMTQLHTQSWSTRGKTELPRCRSMREEPVVGRVLLDDKRVNINRRLSRSVQFLRLPDATMSALAREVRLPCQAEWHPDSQEDWQRAPLVMGPECRRRWFQQTTPSTRKTHAPRADSSHGVHMRKVDLLRACGNAMSSPVVGSVLMEVFARLAKSAQTKDLTRVGLNERRPRITLVYRFLLQILKNFGWAQPRSTLRLFPLVFCCVMSSWWQDDDWRGGGWAPWQSGGWSDWHSSGWSADD